MSIDAPQPHETHRLERSTRARPAKAPLSREAVLDAALELLRRDGLEAVSMRKVAAALDTGAASLYVYVANREALLTAMLDRIVAGIALEEPNPERWRAQLYDLLARCRNAFIAHSGMASLTLAEPPLTQATLELQENMMGILLAGRIDAQDAAWACDIFGMIVTAGAIEDAARRAHEADTSRTLADWAEDIHATFSALPPDRFPLLLAHAGEMVAGDSEDRFRFAVEVVLDGVVARAARR